MGDQHSSRMNRSGSKGESTSRTSGFKVLAIALIDTPYSVVFFRFLMVAVRWNTILS
jgi:hypothetical protein